jgi:hypothetical protein
MARARENPDILAKEEEEEETLAKAQWTGMRWGQCCLLLLCWTSFLPWFLLPSTCADVMSGGRAAASAALVARNVQLASAGLASAAAASTAALNAWGARVAATKCFLRATCEEHLPRD